MLYLLLKGCLVLAFNNGLTTCSLPVTLLSFNATPQPPGTVLLQWQTINETGASQFIVEKGTDSSNFSVMSVMAAKGVNSVTEYTFTDFAAPGGTVYYRLQMLDKDGSAIYSKVVTVNTGGSMSFNIYPNPVRDNLSVKVEAIENENITLQVVDLQGKVVLQKAAALQAGSNSFSVNAGNLTRGFYILIVNGRSMQQKRFIKE